MVLFVVCVELLLTDPGEDEGRGRCVNKNTAVSGKQEDLAGLLLQRCLQAWIQFWFVSRHKQNELAVTLGFFNGLLSCSEPTNKKEENSHVLTL